ncbi:outer envelope pore protein 16-4, chloroplastic isoform X2 [Hevea brasiliensis]|uniref:outer envelope pore protein 16-4, chloroplastic isoform X2 n=1 Tax=Hevea brasiliensis TaxID=3981 RepID=UPI000B7716E7|nr:outer envelope pore protein 16-4, chloroplastic isoform X2 [Hevea brasiliensis]
MAQRSRKLEMEEELNGVLPCSSLAVDSILRVGTAGGIWGSCIGPYDARKRGLSGKARTSFVAKSIGKFGFQCGCNFFHSSLSASLSSRVLQGLLLEFLLFPVVELKDTGKRMTG